MSEKRRGPIVIEMEAEAAPEPLEPVVIETASEPEAPKPKEAAREGQERARPQPDPKPKAKPKPKRKAPPSEPPLNPADAPVISDDPVLPETTAMGYIASYGGRTPNKLFRWFWSALGALVSFLVSVWAYNYITGLLAAHPLVGIIAAVLFALVLVLLLVIAFGELRAYRRLARIDHIQNQAAQAITDNSRSDALKVMDEVSRLYRGRPELADARARLDAQKDQLLDADAIVETTERLLMADLDKAAAREIEAAARQVATVTAIVPLALADVVAALTANLRMVRRVAEIYGGRAGSFGSWRLMRTVLTHLVATGAVAVTDDMIQSIAGGGVLSKVSRRFGEGVVNGALTARVGMAALEVCRPMPYRALKQPSITGTMQRALTGFFGKDKGA